MKTRVFSFLLFASVIMLVQACGESATTAENTEEAVVTEVLAENKESVDMKVEGMTCAMGCAKFIEDKVGDMSGVIASNVNFEEGTATFEFDKSVLSANEIETFIGEIHKGQYSATIIEQNNEVEVDTELDEEESAEETEENITSVREKLNITLPELFTYFVKSLR